MTTAYIEVKMDNAAFDDDASIELASILTELASVITDPRFHVPAKLRDSNGNTVGTFRVK